MLFVSFQDHGHDKENARAFAEGLRSLGVDVWCSAIPGTIPKGTPSDVAVDRALERSTSFVLVASGPIDSKWTLGEIDTALEHAKERANYSVVPVLLPGMRSRELPVALRTLERLALDVEPRAADATKFQEWARALGFTPRSVEVPASSAPSAPVAITESDAALHRSAAPPPLPSASDTMAQNESAAGSGDSPDGRRDESGDDPALRESHTIRRIEPGTVVQRPSVLVAMLAGLLVLSGGYYLFNRFDVVGPNEKQARDGDPSGVAAASSTRAWSDARARLRTDERFTHFELPVQEGLIPLGRNDQSKLEEFAVEGTGAIPEESTRDATGVLPITDDCAIVLVLVPPGSFRMGSPDGVGKPNEHPQHVVTFARPFFIARTELTRTQASTLPLPGPFVASRLPADSLSWDDITNAKLPRGLRLPSEAEWEYACRAGTTTQYSFGDDARTLADHGWHLANSGHTEASYDVHWSVAQQEELGCRVHDVGVKRANPWGLHDMHGNLWESCQDAWHDNYEGAPTDGTAWVEEAFGFRVFRGGSFGIPAEYARSAYRGGSHPSYRWDTVGFRPARSVTTD